MGILIILFDIFGMGDVTMAHVSLKFSLVFGSVSKYFFGQF
jgi:hypothetical protein